MKLTTAQVNTFIKDEAVRAVQIPENAIQIGDYQYAIPVEVENKTRYSVIGFTAKSNKDTKTTVAFDPYRVREEWQEECVRKEAERKEKEEKKRKDAEARANKAKKTAEDNEE